jgi:hypothetical protein
VGNAIKYGLGKMEGDIAVICMVDASDSIGYISIIL